jgi:LytS/YehU family sensor histidine kinase
MAPWIWLAAAVTVPGWAQLARWRLADRRHVALTVLVHVLGVVAVTWITHALWVASFAGQWFLEIPPLALFVPWTLPVWLVITTVHVVETRRRWREREIESARLRAQLAESRIQVLCARLHPHFLFNTLQGISTLIHHRPDAADRMLGHLSDLLRELLTRQTRPFHRLEEELKLLDHYIAICKERFEDRLQFRVRIEAGVEAAAVPYLLLQPLAENAVEHGLARRSGTGSIEVFARREGDSVVFGVVDDGPGIEDAMVERNGLGLTRERLREAYGDRASLELEELQPTGVRTSLSIPFQEVREGAEQ